MDELHTNNEERDFTPSEVAAAMLRIGSSGTRVVRSQEHLDLPVSGVYVGSAGPFGGTIRVSREVIKFVKETLGVRTGEEPEKAVGQLEWKAVLHGQIHGDVLRLNDTLPFSAEWYSGECVVDGYRWEMSKFSLTCIGIGELKGFDPRAFERGETKEW